MKRSFTNLKPQSGGGDMGREKIDPDEISQTTGVEEEDVKDVLSWLVRMGWLHSRHLDTEDE